MYFKPIYTDKNPLLAGMMNESNVTRTENGALANRTTKSAIVDFFGEAGALRSRSEQDIINLFNRAFAEDKLIAMKMLFYMRDIRG